MMGRVGERLPIAIRAHKQMTELVAAIDRDVSEKKRWERAASTMASQST